MARQEINLGTAPTGAGGDTTRSTGVKINAMTTELYGKTDNLRSAAYAAITGTVSQSGGAPTGALFESGSNANGAYVKFADGTMICRRTLGVYSIGPNATLNDGARSFAANFSSTPNLSFAWNCDYPYDISIGAEGGINSSSFRVSMKNRNSSVTVSNIYVDVTAMGRWY